VTIPTSSSWRRDLQTIFHAGTLAGLSDGQLLERIALLRGVGREGNTEVESAFALLIERHGPMVLRVCRGVLGDRHAADDAFQATFLVLLRQAGTIRKRESVGPWLHGVAHRVAASARSAAARRRVHERQWFDRRQETTSKAVHMRDSQDFELAETIHAELDRLPERYRAPIVLCDLEEHSLDEAARQLGWPLGTVKSRLNRGRQQLRDRLVRRGIAPAVAGPLLGGSALIRSAGPTIAISPTLAEATAQMIHSAETVARGSSVSALVLARRVQKAMLMMKLKMTVVGLILAGSTAIGLGVMASGLPLVARDDAPARTGATKPEQQPEKIAKRNNGNAEQPPNKTGRGDDEAQIETIEISGRATDPFGRPVAGATVYVINTNNGQRRDESPLLTTVSTGPDGRFLASGVKLLVPKFQPSPVPGVGECHFQVAGTARGFGFTWHEVACYRPTARPPAEVAPRANTIAAFYQGEPIAIDLAFGPRASLHGKIVDDLGRPIAGAKVQAGRCDNPRVPRLKTSTCVRVDPTNTINSYYRRRFDGIGALPDALFSTRTGPDGAYKLDGLPRDTQLLTLIDPGPEYDWSAEMIATTTLPVEDVESFGYDLVFRHVHSLGYDAVLNHTFVAPRDTRFTVRYADTNLPAEKATIRATRKHEMFRGGNVGETDANGRTTLRLRPGGYELAIEPPPGAPYLPGRASSSLDLRDDLKLQPAARVTLEAIDAKT
jgi:RNA polymerase sigma factor (sigma-70 family)